MSGKGEIIQIHLGQAGVQIGSACWELYCLEHGINCCGQMVHKPVDDSFLTFFQCSPVPYKVVPRVVMIDAEPSVIDEIRNGSYRDLFHPDTLITGNEDSGSNYARGYNWVATEILERAMCAIRFVVSGCRNLRGFIVFHSAGGGTGSGFCTRLLEELCCCYGSKVTIIDFNIFPSPCLSSVIVEPYNATLFCKMSAEFASVSMIVDNEALYDICLTRLGICTPSYVNLNRIIAQVISTFTAPQRFSGPLSVSFEELITNLVPFPKFKYPLTSYSPILSCSRSRFTSPTIEQITFDCFSPCTQLVNTDPTLGKVMSSILLYRGPCFASEISNAVMCLKKSDYLKFPDWCPSGFKTSICSVPPCYVPQTEMVPTNRSVCCISTNSAIVVPLYRLHKKFSQLYEKKAFIYHYVGEGFEENCFNASSEYVLQLISDYKQMESGDINPSEN